MRILHVIRGLANSSGTTHIVGPLAEAQARLGHEVEVFHVEKRGEESVEPDAALVKSTMFPMSVKSRHYGYSRPFTKAMRARVSSFDVVHIHAIWNYVTWSAMRIARSADVPYMVAPQGSLEDWALGRSRFAKRMYASVFEKRLFDRAAAMQTLTIAEQQQCEEFGIQSPSRRLPNGVDLERIDTTGPPLNLFERYGVDPKYKVVLFLGRVFPKKGIDILADSFGRFAKQRSDVTLLVAGHDAGQGYEQSLRDEIASSGAANKCQFLGEVHGNEKFQLLKAADLFVLPSYSEGLPVAVLEAMGTGTPVLVTPGCNIPEVSECEAGWIQSPNASDFMEGMRHAFSSVEELRRRGNNARQLVERKFVWPKIAGNSLEIYRGFKN